LAACVLNALAAYPHRKKQVSFLQLTSYDIGLGYTSFGLSLLVGTKKPVSREEGVIFANIMGKMLLTGG